MSEGDGIAGHVCRGRGQVVGETDRVVCRECGGSGAYRPTDHLETLRATRPAPKSTHPKPGA